MAARHAIVDGLARARARAGWGQLAPMLLVLAVVAGWPLLRTLWFSFTDAQLDGLDNWHFVGLVNYLEHDGADWYGVLADPQWWHAVRVTLWFTAVSVSYTHLTLPTKRIV